MQLNTVCRSGTNSYFNFILKIEHKNQIFWKIHEFLCSIISFEVFKLEFLCLSLHFIFDNLMTAQEF